ncbi:MAG: ArnT family glycosyltransferase, partial [Candidatus Omnitrophota bacterium]
MRPGINRTIFIIIVLVGLILRLWGLGFGLPYPFHQDEPVVVNHALAYGTGDLNPHFFAIPPLTSYLLFFIYGIFFIVGKIFGVYPSAEDFAIQFFKDPTAFYLIGRFFIGVLPGILCIIFTYQLARKFMSVRVALYSSAIMAISFLNVINSHYIYTDMLLVMLTILTYISLFLIYEKSSVRNYCITGIFLGLAVGVKYNAVLLAIPYLLTHLAAMKRNREEWKNIILSRNLWAGGLVSIITFILVNPFMVLDFPGFSGSFMHQAGAFWYTGWKHHIFYSLSEGISLHLAVIGVIGLVLLFFKKAAWGKIFISFPVVFYVVLVYRSQHFARYVLPLVPFLAIGASYLIFEYLYKLFKFPLVQKLIVFISICWLIPTGVKSIKADMLFSSEDTRVVAADWIKENLPKGTKIACDSTNFRPTLKQPYSQLEEKKEFLKEQTGLEEIKAKKLQLM